MSLRVRLHESDASIPSHWVTSGRSYSRPCCARDLLLMTICSSPGDLGNIQRAASRWLRVLRALEPAERLSEEILMSQIKEGKSVGPF